MQLDTLLKEITAMALACLIVSPAVGQEAVDSSQQAPSTTTLTADGQLKGNIAIANASETDQVPSVKVSLVSEGKVIDSVTTDAAGQFSFTNVHPGPYQVVGAAPGFVGSQVLQVAPFTDSHPITTSRQLVLHQSVPTTTYSTYAQAPLSTLSSSPVYSSPTISYAGGGGRAIGGRIGGRLGGRLLGGNGGGFLRSPRGLLVAGGVIGGVVAISDSSPDQ